MTVRPRWAPVVDDDPCLEQHWLPGTCSPVRTLAVPFRWIWDVNGYYRDLGVATDATRRQLRVAYQSLDGPNNSRLTYVFKQLLDPTIRAAYDASPLGQQFYDRYVHEAIIRKTKTRATIVQERTQGMAPMSEEEEDRLHDEVLLEHGFVEDTPDDTLDSEGEQSQDASHHFPFSYFTWRCRSAATADRAEVLNQWQALVSDALRKKGVFTQFSVGLFGRMEHRGLLAYSGGTPIFFLNEKISPSREVAEHTALALKLAD